MSKWKRRRNEKIAQLRVAEQNARRRAYKHSSANPDYWDGVARGLAQAQVILRGEYETVLRPEFIEGEIGPDLLSKRKPRV